LAAVGNRRPGRLRHRRFFLQDAGIFSSADAALWNAL